MVASSGVAPVATVPPTHPAVLAASWFRGADRLGRVMSTTPRVLTPGWPVSLHHLVGDAAPQHRATLVHEAGEQRVCLVVGDAYAVVDATIKGDVEAEGEESHEDESIQKTAR
jgi:hypothetical protein